MFHNYKWKVESTRSATEEWYTEQYSVTCEEKSEVEAALRFESGRHDLPVVLRIGISSLF